jgi:hypothetical protein
MKNTISREVELRFYKVPFFFFCLFVCLLRDTNRSCRKRVATFPFGRAPMLFGIWADFHRQLHVQERAVTIITKRCI